MTILGIVLITCMWILTIGYIIVGKDIKTTQEYKQESRFRIAMSIFMTIMWAIVLLY